MTVTGETSLEWYSDVEVVAGNEDDLVQFIVKDVYEQCFDGLWRLVRDSRPSRRSSDAGRQQPSQPLPGALLLRRGEPAQGVGDGLGQPAVYAHEGAGRRRVRREDRGVVVDGGRLGREV